MSDSRRKVKTRGLRDEFKKSNSVKKRGGAEKRKKEKSADKGEREVGLQKHGGGGPKLGESGGGSAHKRLKNLKERTAKKKNRLDLRSY